MRRVVCFVLSDCSNSLGLLYGGRRFQSRPSGIFCGGAHVSCVDPHEPGADGLRVRGFAVRTFSPSSGILKRATNLRALHAFASPGRLSGSAGGDCGHFRGVAARAVRARDRPRFAKYRTAFHACGGGRCDPCGAGAADDILSRQYYEVTPRTKRRGKRNHVSMRVDANQCAICGRPRRDRLVASLP